MGTLDPGHYAYEKFVIFRILAAILNFAGNGKCQSSQKSHF